MIRAQERLRGRHNVRGAPHEVEVVARWGVKDCASLHRHSHSLNAL